MFKQRKTQPQTPLETIKRTTKVILAVYRLARVSLAFWQWIIEHLSDWT